MKSFTEFLTESKKTYPFKIGVAGTLPEGFVDSMEKALKKYDVTSTAQLSSNASNTAGASSDFFLNIVKNDLTGLRVTVKNNSTSSAGAMTINHLNGSTAIGTASAALASGTNMIGNTSLVAAFADENSYTESVTQNSSVWNLEHNLGRFPAVQVVDTAGSVVIGDIQYVDQNNITITFSAPFQGTAYLN